MRGLTKALFGQAAIAFGQRGLAQPELNEGVFGRVIGSPLKSIDRVICLAAIEQDNSVQHRDLGIFAVLFHQLGNHGLGGGKVTDLKQNADVSLLHRDILGVLLGQACELRPGLVNLS